MDVTDGQKLTLGDTTLTLYITPGHTPATISTVIPVTDHGKPHMLAFWVERRCRRTWNQALRTEDWGCISNRWSAS